MHSRRDSADIWVILCIESTQMTKHTFGISRNRVADLTGPIASECEIGCDCALLDLGASGVIHMSVRPL